jgi:hypothetical protein
MAVSQLETEATDDSIREAVQAALAAQGGITVKNEPGSLTMDLGGTVGKAYLAGGLRDKMKMPMQLVVTTASGPGGTGVTIDVHSRGTAGGLMSGGLLGMSKQRKAEQAWLQMAVDAVNALSAPPA